MIDRRLDVDRSINRSIGLNGLNGGCYFGLYESESLYIRDVNQFDVVFLEYAHHAASQMWENYFYKFTT